MDRQAGVLGATAWMTLVGGLRKSSGPNCALGLCLSFNLTDLRRVRMNMLCTDGPIATRERKWRLQFDDPDKGYAIYDNEPEAMRAWDQAKDNWTCTLFVTAEFVQPPPWTTELQLATNGN